MPQCHFAHRKSQMIRRGANPGRRGGKPAANRLSYGTAPASWLRYFLLLMEPESSLSSSLDPAIGPYPKPDESNLLN
jgi:hypothetical protein